jgi:hypothetical protein
MYETTKLSFGNARLEERTRHKNAVTADVTVSVISF